MKIETDKQVMVFRRDTEYGTNYSIGLSRKNKNGEYSNAYIPVRFKSDNKLEDKTKIYIKDGFLSFYLKQDESPVFYIMIMEYEIAEENKEKSVESVKQEEIDPFKEFAEENEIKDSDLPF